MPAIVSLPDDRDVYIKIINGGRASYIDWSNPERDVKPRLKLYFTPPLHTKLDSSLDELKEIVICRNAIAHSSGSARKNLNDLWGRKKGTSKSSLTRCADVLLLDYPLNPPLTLFDRYLHVLEALSQNLAQI